MRDGKTALASRRPFQRTDRLNREIRDVLAKLLLLETREESLRSVMITAVEVSRDLSIAKVYYQNYAGDPAMIAEALSRAAGFLRGRVGEKVRMRQTPELRFYYDESAERGRRIETLLSSLPELQPEDVGEAEGD